jgi:hypothetical protein
MLVCWILNRPSFARKVRVLCVTWADINRDQFTRELATTIPATGSDETMTGPPPSWSVERLGWPKPPRFEALSLMRTASLRTMRAMQVSPRFAISAAVPDVS